MGDRREERRVSAASWASSTGGFEPTAVKKPSGMENYRLDREGEHVFDIIPFIAGKGNHHADPGFEFFMRVYDVHKIPKPDGNSDSYCCLWSEWKESCPVCKARRNLPEEEAGALRPQQRILFLVNDKPGKLKNPLKLLDTVMFNRKLGFGEQLKIAINATRGGGDFAKLVGGMTVKLQVGNAKYRQVARIDLIPRDYDYPEDWLEKSPCLDEFIIKPQASVINTLLGEMGVEGADEEDTAPSEAPRRAAAARSDDEEAAPKRTAAPARSAADDEDDEEAAPPRKAAPAAAPKAVAKPAPDEDDEEDASPPPKKSAAPKQESANGAALKVGQQGLYKGLEVTITKVTEDGKLVSFSDEDGEMYKNIAASEVKVAKAAPARAAKPADDDEDDDD